MLFRPSSDLDVLFGKDTYNAGGDFVVDDSFIVLAHDVDAEFLGWN
jgi:hypothetical protein